MARTYRVCLIMSSAGSWRLRASSLPHGRYDGSVEEEGGRASAAEPARGSTAPIFVVGTPRSGTTLLASMLGAHPRIDCGPEPLFLPRLEAADAAALLKPATWPDAATDFVMSLHLQDASVAELYGRDRTAVRAWLAARKPSVAAMLESLTAARAEADRKPRWAEKTPRHLLSLPAIRAAWPDAQIVRVVRDPRDVALSASRVPFADQSVVVNLCLCARQDRIASDFFATDRNSHVLRFEDLLAEPQAELEQLCRFLGESYDPVMVERPDAATGLAADHEWWKHKAAEPLDPSRAGAWRGEMSEVQQRVASLVCREQLEAFGYEGAVRPSREVAVVPLGDTIVTKLEGLVTGLAEHDAVIAEPPPLSVDELGAYRDIVFWGLRDQLGLALGTTPLQQSINLVRLAVLLAARRLTRRPVWWVARRTQTPPRHAPGDRVASRLVQALSRRVAREELPQALGAAPQSEVDLR